MFDLNQAVLGKMTVTQHCISANLPILAMLYTLNVMQ